MKIIEIYPIGRVEGDDRDPNRSDGYSARMPMGAKVLALCKLPTNDPDPTAFGLGCSALVSPTAPLKEFNFFIATVGDGLQPALGREIGSYVGQVNTPAGPLMAFHDTAARSSIIKAH
jgi:hypothetical protein